MTTLVKLSFASLVFLTACATTPDNNSSAADQTIFFQALGASPHWSVEVMDSSIAFSSEDFDSKQKFPVSKSDDGEFKSYQNVEKTQKFSLVLEQKPCLDKVSSKNMRYAATFTFGDITYLGCAQPIDH